MPDYDKMRNTVTTVFLEEMKLCKNAEQEIDFIDSIIGYLGDIRKCCYGRAQLNKANPNRSFPMASVPDEIFQKIKDELKSGKDYLPYSVDYRIHQAVWKGHLAMFSNIREASPSSIPGEGEWIEIQIHEPTDKRPIEEIPWFLAEFFKDRNIFFVREEVKNDRSSPFVDG